jgi:hypothetical protein
MIPLWVSALFFKRFFSINFFSPDDDDFFDEDLTDVMMKMNDEDQAKFVDRESAEILAQTSMLT